MPDPEEAARKVSAATTIGVVGVVVAALGVWAGLFAAGKAPCPSAFGFCRNPHDEQEAFVSSYFADLESKDIAGAWEKLGAGFQSRNGGDFAQYQHFWDSVSYVQLVTVNSLAAGKTDKRVRAQWRITYQDPDIATETVHSVFTLVRSRDGRLLIEGACDMRTDSCDTAPG